jgi:glycosyltransferase involved in cell wall biosynthesis
MANEKLAPTQSRPLVSIITPFYNAQPYLAECIESVLTQTYPNWEYILVNNQSTDTSRSIAEHYVAMDGRLRLVDTPRHLCQIESCEGALRHMSPESRYCKMVLADDWIFPGCVERMVEVAEANPTVGIVSSYQLFGNEISGSGLPYPSTVISGREACRVMLLHDDYFITGQQTSIMIRADLVRKAHPFFPVGWVHEDTEACFQVLADHDFGFVHQVLTFSRESNGSLTSTFNRFGPGPLRKFMFAQKYGPRFLDQREYREHFRRTSDRYGQFLASSLFTFKDREFWDFHRRGLQAVGCSFWSIGLPKYVLMELFDIIFNPKKTAGRLVRMLRDLRGQSRDLEKPGLPPSERTTARG